MAGPVKLKIGGYDFTSYPLREVGSVNVAAIYVIIGVQENGSFKYLDVGQSGELGERLDNHPRQDCWRRHCPYENLWVCVYQTPSAQFSKEQRLALEKKLRTELSPPCGER